MRRRRSSARPNEACAGMKARMEKRPLPSRSSSRITRDRLLPSTAYVPATDSVFRTTQGNKSRSSQAQVSVAEGIRVLAV